MIQKRILEVVSILFVLLFVYAAVSKLMDYERFSNQIGYTLFLRPISKWLGWLVPTSELIIAVMLVLPRYRKWAFYATLMTMTIFTGYIIAILLFSGPNVPCSCGGILEKMSWNAHIIFNVVFIGFAITGIILEKNIRKAGNFKLSTVIYT